MILQNEKRAISALNTRNKSWEKSTQIPRWVNIDGVGLDQFFTRPEIAKTCWKSFYDYVSDKSDNMSQYDIIEPSAGPGAFYDLLPKKRRIGIDVVEYRGEYIKKDFLSWLPKKNGHKYICVGNPPFGYRAWLALAFLQHAALFSDYAGFILPMAFQSEGKGNPKDRVKGLHLVKSIPLPQDSFMDVHGKSVKINALWQIWSRRPCGRKSVPKTCNKYIDLFTVDMRKERLCGQKRLKEADYFLQRTFYTEPPGLVTTFAKVRYVCGYGIVIKHKKVQVLKVLKNADWKKYSNLAIHNCRHISMCHIRKALTDAGLSDV